MTQDITQIIRDWLEEAPSGTGEPVHLYPAIDARVHQTPQQRGYLPPFHRRFQPMYSATKLVVASVILALSGGFLLASVITQPSDDTNPGVTETSLPASTPTPSDLLSRLETEEVAPGVLRVTGDGTGNEIASNGSLLVSDEGTVWTWSHDSVRELGQQGHEGRIEGRPALGPDGSLWAVAKNDCRDRLPPIRSFDGETWTTRNEGFEAPVSGKDPRWPPDYFVALAVIRDGVAWAAGANCGDPAHLSLLRLGPEGWTIYSLGDGLPAKPCAPDCGELWEIETTPDGNVWLTMPESGLFRFDGSAWEVVRPLGGDVDHRVLGLASNLDGVLWAEIEVDDAVASPESRLDAGRYLARLDAGQAWEVFPSLPGGGDFAPVGVLAVGPDGAVWLADAYSDQDHAVRVTDADLRNVKYTSVPVSFDGERWRRFPQVLQHWGSVPANEPVIRKRDGRGQSLIGTSAIAVGPDGRVWVTVAGGSDLSSLRRGLYIISPEAVSAVQ